MNVQDLRIGNLIYNDFGEIQPIYGVDEKSILTKVDDNGWSISFKPKPIPLTEEWLQKFGFVQNKDGDFKLFKDSEVEILIKNNFWTCDGIVFSSGNLKYVHQLQNLYFALTGTELTVA